ncbi:MAG: alpha/beta fold hydrolase [Vicinamibacterales bacterium]
MRRTLTSAGRRLHYREAGEGAPLVLLHAFPLSADLWEPQLAAPPAGWRLLAPDFRGFGASTSEGARHVDAHVEDVLGLLDGLGLERVALAGLSMGGYVALALAKLAPERLRALVLVDTRAESDTPEGRETRTRMQQLALAEGARAIADAWIPKLVGPTTLESRPAVLTTLRAIIEPTSPTAIADALETLKTRPDSRPLLPFITVPTLVVVGEEDGLTPVAMSEAMHRRLPHATLVVIPQAGHLASLERPQAFNEALTAFLATL